MSYANPLSERRKYVFSIHGVTNRNHWRQRQEQRRSRHYRSRIPQSASLFDRLIHPENLLQVFLRLRASAGQAPGVDRLRYTDVSASEMAGILRVISAEIRDGYYRPQPTRKVRVPKTRGGHRTLRLGTIIDRVVSSAVLEAIGTDIDSRFLPNSFGFRPHRSTWQMLAYLESTMLERRWSVLAIDDVRQAFDHVPIARLRPFIAEAVDEKIVALIERILRGSNRSMNPIGVDQGNALSPLLLNLLLHEHLDRPWTTDNSKPVLARYADNIALVCQDVSGGHEGLHAVAGCLQAVGLTLKGHDGPPVDLSDGNNQVELLGFVIRQGEMGLQFDPGREAWANLAQAFRKAHLASSPPTAARLAAIGWLEAYGPALNAEMRPTVDRIYREAVRAGHTELALRGDLELTAVHAHQRWERVRAMYSTSNPA